MRYEEYYDRLILQTELSLKAYEYYVEYGWSLRKCAANLEVSHTWIKKSLEDLLYIDREKYDLYRKKLKENTRNAGYSN